MEVDRPDWLAGANSRSSAAPVRCGFSRFKRSMSAAAVGSQTAGPAEQMAAHAGEQEAVSGDPAGGFEHGQGAVDEAGSGGGFGQRSQRGAQCFGLRAEAANPELAALIGHWRWRGLGAVERSRQQQARDEKQRNHRQTAAQVR